jgi:hypothetical protein
MNRIHATNTVAHEKPNTNSATATTATTKQSVILEKSQRIAKNKAFSYLSDYKNLTIPKVEDKL